MKTLGAYIHIPFCKQKCIYCDFISFADRNNLKSKYIEAVLKEIENWKEYNKNIMLDTIYIGGGTPSYVESNDIIKILESLKPITLKNAQITIEVNPGTVDYSRLKDYKEAGINRLSIGLQSTKNSLLKSIGRIHNFEEFLDTYKCARKVGFNNVNVDLMIGLPDQSIQDIKDSLKTVVELGAEHISVYSLIVEENTRMQELIENGTLKLPEEDTERNMYWYVKNYLELNGYKHYEISNFSKLGFESKHNLNCWNQKEYIGFGLAAHSYIGNKRFSNIEDLERYIKNIQENKFNENIVMQENQTEFEKEKEFMLLGLRKIDGVSIQDFKNKFTENPIFLFKKELNKLTEEKLIIIDDDKIRLTEKGIDLANIVWEEFI